MRPPEMTPISHPDKVFKGTPYNKPWRSGGIPCWVEAWHQPLLKGERVQVRGVRGVASGEYFLKSTSKGKPSGKHTALAILLEERDF